MGDTSGSGGARSTQYIIAMPNSGEIIDIVTPRAGADGDTLAQQLQGAMPRGARVMAYVPTAGQRLNRREMVGEDLGDFGISMTERRSSGRTLRELRSLTATDGGATQVGREASPDRRARQAGNRSARLRQARARQTRIINQANRDGVSASTRRRRLNAAGLPTNTGFSIADLNRAARR